MKILKMCMFPNNKQFIIEEISKVKFNAKLNLNMLMIFYHCRREAIKLKTKFLAFSYKIPSEPSKNRVYFWRTIKDLGAVYLQHGIILLPKNEEILNKLQELRYEVIKLKGRATVSEISFINEDDKNDIMFEFEKLRKEEYEELSKECEKIIREINREIENKKFKFSELEENEEELEKIKRWFKKIVMRDYYNISEREIAVEKIKSAEIKLQRYSEEVCKRENSKFHCHKNHNCDHKHYYKCHHR